MNEPSERDFLEGLRPEDQEEHMRDLLAFKDGAMEMTPEEQAEFDRLAAERVPRLAKALPVEPSPDPAGEL